MPGKPTRKPRSTAQNPSKPTPLPPARAVALDALDRCLPAEAPRSREAGQGMDAQAALDRALRQAENNGLSARDAALATEIFYGVLRCKTRLEYILGRFLDRPDGLPERAVTAMTVAAYELLHLDRVPARASVNWGVDAVRAVGGKPLGGLANAVLRKVAALAEHPFEPGFFGPEGHPETLARQFACPLWIVELWLEEYGPKTAQQLLEAQIQSPAAGFAVVHQRPDARDVAAQLADQPGCLAAQGLGVAFAPGSHPELPVDGAVVRQSFAGRKALLALSPADWPEPVWDACAGRGGKTRILAELGKSVQASDIHRGRIRALRTELPDIPALVASALDRPPFDETPATILLDAPCSGLGTLARRPDIKWKRREEDVDTLVELQANLLVNAWKRLPRGGVLAYLTCTLNPDENERQVAAFLADHDRASLETEWTTAPDAPWGEFFYAALLRKSDAK